jgi:MFS family permease
MSKEAFAQWGWRIPFGLSLVLLLFSVYIRLKLEESPVFKKIKAEGKTSKAPLTESFGNWKNGKIVLLALLGATAGQGVVWYTGQFYALFFLTISLKLDFQTAYIMIAISLLIATPFFVVFGRLSDRIGRKNIIMAGCLLGALLYFPLFKGLTHFVNPELEAATDKTPISVAASDCNFHVFVGPWSKFSDCDKAKDFLTKQGISFSSLPGVEGEKVVTKVGDVEIKGWDEPKYKAAVKAAGFPTAANPAKINYVAAEAILILLVLLVTMVYGPIAAFLVELFPASIRYTSMSLPYHIGNGWFGGMLPLLATAMVAASGNIYYGLWYPVVVAAMTLVIGTLFLRETKDHKVRVDLV